MAIIPSTFKLDWYDPSQPGGVTSALNDNANTATSNATQYTMEDIINTVSYTGGSIDGSGAQWALPVFTDTNTITNLPLGVAGELLTSGGPGVDPAWGAAPSTGPYAVGGGTDSAVLVGDNSNVIAADAFGAVISGGYNNTMATCAVRSVISGGCDNTITGQASAKGDPTTSNAFIGGGELHDIQGAFDAIGGGYQNCTCGGEGKAGPTQGGYHFIGGGVTNEAYGVANIVGGGISNRAYCFFDGKEAIGMNAILGGESNMIDGAAYALVGAGNKNSIYTHDPAAAVEFGSAIAGGGGNVINLSSGEYDGNQGQGSFIGGGMENCIVDTQLSTISGGEGNLIESNAATQAAGTCTRYGTVGGGRQNTINDLAGTIGGGCCNHIATGKYSSITGGCQNVTCCDNSHAIGSSITTTRIDTTFVNNLNVGQAVPLVDYADNVAALAGGLTAGDVYRLTGADTLNIVH